MELKLPREMIEDEWTMDGEERRIPDRKDRVPTRDLLGKNEAIWINLFTTLCELRVIRSTAKGEKGVDQQAA